MKSVYTGGEKVAEFESYDELRVGENKPAFIYEGNELVYPSPVKDGLVLWYDFSGRTNADSQRGIAEDLSGNGNHGTLQNFNYTSESGYDKNKLLFDGVDDYARTDDMTKVTGVIGFDKDYSLEIVFKTNSLNGGLMSSGYNEDRNGIYIQDGTLVSGYYSSTVGWNGFHLNESLEQGRLYCLSVNKKGGDISFALNGVTGVTSRGGVYMSVAGSAFGYVGIAGHGRIPRYLDGSIYSIKLYNKPLTSDEMRLNYAIEKERFGIE